MFFFRALAAAAVVMIIALPARVLSREASLPAFGRDTVLVYKSEMEQDIKSFVVRIAEFFPDRFIEWEDSVTQGTIFMPASAVQDARGFVNSSLFEAGVDTKGKQATTLWLSRRLFRELKEKKKVKVALDSIDTWVTLDSNDQVPVEVNRTIMNLPAIKTVDERQSVRWFLDSEENPLLLKHVLRRYTQILASITTDRPNTLRWIKGKKLPKP